MAIYINDKVLRADAKGTKLEREYHAGLEKINQLFEKFRLKGSDISFIQITRKSENRILSITTKKVKRLPPVALPVEVPYYDDEIGATTIRYSKTPPQKLADNKLTWSTKWIEFRESLTVSDKEKDLAWFLVFASSFIKKGTYQVVDNAATYEGSYNEIITKKNVMDSLTSGDRGLLEVVVKKFLDQGYLMHENKELAVKVTNWLETSKKWEAVWNEILAYNSANVKKKENVSEFEYDGEPVTMQQCPDGMKMEELRGLAKELDIALTVPPQSKNVLYSLIQHVKAKNVATVDE